MESSDTDGIEAYYEDSGALQPLSDNDTVVLFRDLEHELEGLVQRYHVPPGDLEKLFQVWSGDRFGKSHLVSFVT